MIKKLSYAALILLISSQTTSPYFEFIGKGYNSLFGSKEAVKKVAETVMESPSAVKKVAEKVTETFIEPLQNPNVTESIPNINVSTYWDKLKGIGSALYEKIPSTSTVTDTLKGVGTQVMQLNDQYPQAKWVVLGTVAAVAMGYHIKKYLANKKTFEPQYIDLKNCLESAPVK